MLRIVHRAEVAGKRPWMDILLNPWDEARYNWLRVG